MGVDGTLTPGCCSFLGLASLPGSAECEEVTLGARRVRGRGSLGRGHRKGRGKGGLVVGGLAPREATLSGDAVGISEMGTCRGQWRQPPGPGKASQGALRPDPVQTSADKFGISVAEVTPMRDIVTERKELDWKPVILI